MPTRERINWSVIDYYTAMNMNIATLKHRNKSIRIVGEMQKCSYVTHKVTSLYKAQKPAKFSNISFREIYIYIYS